MWLPNAMPPCIPSPAPSGMHRPSLLPTAPPRHACAGAGHCARTAGGTQTGGCTQTGGAGALCGLHAGGGAGRRGARQLHLCQLCSAQAPNSASTAPRSLHTPLPWCRTRATHHCTRATPMRATHYCWRATHHCTRATHHCTHATHCCSLPLYVLTSLWCHHRLWAPRCAATCADHHQMTCHCCSRCCLRSWRRWPL